MGARFGCQIRDVEAIIPDLNGGVNQKAQGSNPTRRAKFIRYEFSLVSGKVLYHSPELVSIVVGGGVLARERFEIPNCPNERFEGIRAPADNGGCILAGWCSRS